ncbi:synaptosomal-associated protein 29 [Lingula anatina]|uniref:Synaptosomal-associated protein 29 n=1 Tax=Lingula anatina TaxID=7574 RepID=A0A1S3J981_LINAN|nr:synaptosomal-associated protein 29 [Lingula anatina]|eukprot:XP_013406429.1 synaptosomal-associated protein 29 [Lingula anatina]
MAGRRGKGSNPFDSDDEDDPWGSGSSSRTSNSYGDGNRGPSDADSRREWLMQQKLAAQERTLESTQRSMASLYESERMGIDTAEELVRQGEQLDNIETKVARINQDTKTSQKHLNNIKSIFGGIKNWFSKDKEPPATIPEREPSSLQTWVEGQSGRDDLQERDHNPDNHPAMRIRNSEGRGAVGGTGRGQTQAYGGKRDAYDEQVDKNLDEMSGVLSRLQFLGKGLGTEIDRQNEQIDRIDLATEKATTNVDDQNKQMRKILYK